MYKVWKDKKLKVQSKGRNTAAEYVSSDKLIGHTSQKG